MDVELRPAEGGQWDVVDLLGRTVGTVESQGMSFTVKPVGAALVGMTPGPFTSLDAVCAAVGAKVRGRCRLVPGKRA